MNKKRVKQIEEIAFNILIETGQKLPPIKVEKIVEKKGLSLKKIDFDDDVSGVFLSDGIKASIGVNQNNSERRQRFTIAHELGHFVLGHKRQNVFVDSPSKYYTILFRDKDSSTGEYLQEREANAFAAALLMPLPLIKAEMRTYYNADSIQEDFDLIEQLCNKFNVSRQAMTLRLTNLDLSW